MLLGRETCAAATNQNVTDTTFKADDHWPNVGILSFVFAC